MFGNSSGAVDGGAGVTGTAVLNSTQVDWQKLMATLLQCVVYHNICEAKQLVKIHKYLLLASVSWRFGNSSSVTKSPRSIGDWGDSNVAIA
jgi:hypothetical protein